MRPDLFKQVRSNNDNYESTVHTLLAFSACIVHDGKTKRTGSHFGFGRTMTTSVDNHVSPSTKISPDAVVQMTTDYGAVAEVKRSIDRDAEHWDNHLTQLAKYDDNLSGWWTTNSRMSAADAVLLLHQSRSRAFVKHLEKRQAEGSFKPTDRMSIIEFSRSEEAETFIFLRREWGKNSNAEISAKLEDGVSIPLNTMLMSFPSLKFYDHEPPLNYLLVLLWTDVLPAMQQDVAQATDDGTTTIEVQVEKITVELQRAYGSLSLERDGQSAEFPQRSWIRRALEALVEGGLAEAGTGEDTFRVRFRPFLKDVQEKLYSLTEGRGKAKTVEQIEMPLGQKAK